MKKYIKVFLIIILLSCISCNKKSLPTQKIWVDIFPIYSITKLITGKNTSINTVIPHSAEPHHYEITAQNRLNLDKADIFLYCSAFSPEINKLAQNLNTIAIDVCRNAKVVKPAENGSLIDTHNHSFYDSDPHIWLDFDNALLIAGNIYKTLIDIFPSKQDEYKDGFKKFNSEIKILKQKYETGLKNCKHKTIIHCGHFSFAYIAKKYGFKYLALLKTHHAGEPGFKELMETTQYIKKNKMKYIFTDAFLNPKFAKTIAKQTETEILNLNAMGHLTKEDTKKNKDYISIAYENLENLKKGLLCLK